MTRFCLWQSRMMVHELYQDPKIVVQFGDSRSAIVQ